MKLEELKMVLESDATKENEMLKEELKRKNGIIKSQNKQLNALYNRCRTLGLIFCSRCNLSDECKRRTEADID